MEFEQLNQFSDDSFDESTNIRSLVEKYLSQIKWFFIKCDRLNGGRKV